MDDLDLRTCDDCGADTEDWFCVDYGYQCIDCKSEIEEEQDNE